MILGVRRENKDKKEEKYKSNHHTFNANTALTTLYIVSLLNQI